MYGLEYVDHNEYVHIIMCITCRKCHTYHKPLPAEYNIMDISQLNMITINRLDHKFVTTNKQLPLSSLGDDTHGVCEKVPDSIPVLVVPVWKYM